MAKERDVDFLKELYKQHKTKTQKTSSAISKEERYCVEQMRVEDSLFISDLQAKKFGDI